VSDPRARRLAAHAAAHAGGDVMGVVLDPQSGAGRFFRLGQDTARLYLGLRLLLGRQRLRARRGERTAPARLRTGRALRDAREGMVAVPAQGSPPIAIAYPAYRTRSGIRNGATHRAHGRRVR